MSEDYHSLIIHEEVAAAVGKEKGGDSSIRGK